MREFSKACNICLPTVCSPLLGTTVEDLPSLSYHSLVLQMSGDFLIAQGSFPYKEKLVTAGYEEVSQLPPTRDDADWSLLLHTVLSPPELIKLKNFMFPKNEGKTNKLTT